MSRHSDGDEEHPLAAKRRRLTEAPSEWVNFEATMMHNDFQPDEASGWHDPDDFLHSELMEIDPRIPTESNSQTGHENTCSLPVLSPPNQPPLSPSIMLQDLDARTSIEDTTVTKPIADDTNFEIDEVQTKDIDLQTGLFEPGGVDTTEVVCFGMVTE